MTHKFYCLNCKKDVDTFIDIFKGMSISCKKCGTSRVIKLEKIDNEKFEEMVRKFKEKTGEII